MFVSHEFLSKKPLRLIAYIRLTSVHFSQIFVDCSQIFLKMMNEWDCFRFSGLSIVMSICKFSGFVYHVFLLSTNGCYFLYTLLYHILFRITRPFFIQFCYIVSVMLQRNRLNILWLFLYLCNLFQLWFSRFLERN